MAVYKSIYICYAQSTDSDHPRILLRKPRTELLRNNPRITHVNLGSTRNLLGSRSQTSAIRGNKPTIDRARKAAFCSANLGSARNPLGSSNQTTAIRGNTQPNLGHPHQQTHDRSRTQSSSAIRINEATIDRIRKAVRSSAAKKQQSIAHAKQIGHPLQ